MSTEGDPDATVITVDLAWQSVVAALVATFVLAMIWVTIGAASGATTLIVVSLFGALALDPVVRAVERATPLERGWSTVVVLSGVVMAVGMFAAIAGPQLVAESANLRTQLPRTLDSLNDLPVVGERLRDADVADKLTQFVSSLPQKLELSGARIGGIVQTVSFGVGAALIGFFLLAGALLEGPRLVAMCRAALPSEQRDAADSVGRVVYDVIARYFAGSLLIAVLNGIWTASAAIIAGVPLSPVLAVWAALTSLTPQIGGLMGFALVFVVSLTAGIGPMLIMSVAFGVFMLFTNHVLIPTVVGRAVSLSPPVTMLAAVGGFSVAGIVGALFAVPTFGAIKAVVAHLRGEVGAVQVDEVDVHPAVSTRIRRLAARLRRGRPTDRSESTE